MKISAKGAEKKVKRVYRKSRRSLKAYSDYIYRVKVSPAVCDLVVVPGYLRKALCSKVGDEAARLAKLNRRGTITQREVCSAVRTVWKEEPWKARPAQ